METVAKLIEHPELLTQETLYGLREVVASYPYYQAARLLFLQNLFLLHDHHFGEELRKAAIFIPDRRVLFSMVEGINYEIQSIPIQHEEYQNTEKNTDRTLSLIDNFLQTSGETVATAPNRKLTTIDPTTDYAAYLLTLEDAQPEEQSKEINQTKRSAELINQFIDKKQERIQLHETPEFMPEGIVSDEKENDKVEEEYLTMTLAKIYIKQQRYEKALEIIKKINSYNPKKSTYFADQIRFLQKLIINKKYQNS